MDFFNSTTEPEQTTSFEDLQQSDTVEATTESETVENQTPEDVTDSELEQPEPQLKKVSLNFDDTDYEIDVPEVIADRFKNGVMMQADYTRSKQKLSEEAKAIEARQTEFDSALNELRSQLEYEQQQLNSEEMQELKEYDSEAYYKKMNSFNERVNNYNKHLQKRNEEQAKAHQEAVQKEMDSYPTHIPEWLDDKVKNDEMNLIGKYLKDSGFSEQEFNSIYPAKFMKVVRAAALYDKAVKSGQEKKKQTPPSTTKPRSTNQVKPKETSLYSLFAAQMNQK